MKLSLSITTGIFLVFVCINYVVKSNDTPNDTPINIKNEQVVTKSNQVLDTLERKKINQLDQTVIRQFSKTNSCYLPLVNDSSFFNQKSNIRFSWLKLFNDSLPGINPYRNRYLVGDFMALNEQFESR